MTSSAFDAFGSGHLVEGYPLKDVFLRILGRLRAWATLSPAPG